MSKMSRSVSFSSDRCKYPTRSHFENIAEAGNKRSLKREPLYLKDKPMLPEYLREIPSSMNPFSIIKFKRTPVLKKLEKERKEFNVQKLKNFPIEETVNRYVRMKFNANYELKKFKFLINMHEDFDNTMEKPESKKTIPKQDRRSNHDFIAEKRQICLLDCAINITKKKLLELDRIVKEEAKLFEDESNDIDVKKQEDDSYMKKVCQQTYEASQMAEKQMRSRIRVLRKVKKAQYVLAKLNAECIHLEDEYLKLKTYRDFLQKCDVAIRSKQNIEKTSIINQLKMDAITMEKEIQLLVSNANSQSTMFDDVNDTNQDNRGKEAENKSNAENEDEDSIIKHKPDSSICVLQTKQGIFTKEQLVKLKEMVFNGFNINNIDENVEMLHVINANMTNNLKYDNKVEILNESFDDDSLEELYFDENSIFYKDPSELVNIFSELEIRNLSLIENVQEQEEMCDYMRKKIGKIKSDLNRHLIMIDERIKEETKSINEIKDSIRWVRSNQTFLDSFNNSYRYKEFFYLDNLNELTIDELMEYMTKQITELYNSVFETATCEKMSTVNMLKEIEILVDSQYLQIQMFDKKRIQQAKRVINERKRLVNAMRLQQVFKEARAKKLRMTIEKFKQPPKYRFGRKVVYRSVPPSQIVRVPKVNTEKIRQLEENAYFFTL